MGMDYQYAGSARYGRFDDELCAVAKFFGGIKTAYLKELEATANEKPYGYWLGFLSSDDTNNKKFVFPKGTNEVLVKWFNNIYGEDFTVEETKAIWECVSEHPEIKNISYQIWYELEMLNEEDEAWYIS